MTSRRLVPGVVIASFAVLALLLVTACGGDSDSERIDALEARIAAIEESADHGGPTSEASLAATLTALNTVGFHGIDDDMQQATEVPPFLVGQIRKARQVMAATEWPEEIRTEADALYAALQQFEDALDHDDLQGAKTGAKDAHDLWHDLEVVAYPLLAGEEPADHGQNGDDDNGHGEEEEHADDENEDEDNGH